MVVIGQLRAMKEVYVFVTVLAKVDPSVGKYSMVRVTVDVTSVPAGHSVN